MFFMRLYQSRHRWRWALLPWPGTWPPGPGNASGFSPRRCSVQTVCGSLSVWRPRPLPLHLLPADRHGRTEKASKTFEYDKWGLQLLSFSWFILVNGCSDRSSEYLKMKRMHLSYSISKKLTCPFILLSGLIFCLGTYPLFTRIVML